MKKVFTLIAAILALTCMACKGTIVDNSQNHTVTFQTNGADSISSKSVEDGEKVSEPDPAPQKNGYDFMGWYTDSSFTTKYDFDTPVTSNITLYAKWKIQTFSIVFYTNGGSAVETQIVEYDKTVAIPANPTKDGYEFGGWYLGKDFETARKFDFATKIHGNYKLYAKWVEKTQQNNPDNQVDTTDPKNNEGEEQATEVDEDDEGEEKNEGETNNEGLVKDEGETKGEGETDDDGEGTSETIDPVDPVDPVDSVDPVDPVNPPEPPQPVFFKVTFETNGGTAIVQVQVQDGETVSKPKNPEKEGYSFEGWYSTSNFAADSKYDFNDAVFEDIILYAKWKYQSYIINFVIEEGPEVPSQTVRYEGTVAKPSDPEKENAEFRGWFLDKKFTKAYDFTTPVTADLTLYGNLYEFPIDDEVYTESNKTEYTSKYPEKFEYPKYHDTTESVAEQLSTGQSVNSTDGIITVTPRSDGLWIVVNYKAANASVYWKHNTIKIKDTTNGKEKETGILEVPIVETDSSKTTTVLFPFTVKGRKYNVWIEHQGTQTNEWADWASTSEKAATVTAIGGLGEFRVTCADMNYSVNYDSSRKLTFNKYEVYKPSALNGITPTAKVRAENGSRWAGAYVEKENFPFPAEVVQIDNSELISFLDKKQQLFIVVNYNFEFEGLKYQQEVYSNYDYTQYGQHHNNWIKDPGALEGIGQLPLIKITSTENGGSNQFVTVPISPHVKDQQGGGKANIPDPEYENCTIAVDDGEAYTGQVKVRGNWTTNYDKKSLRIKFDKKHSMCGLNNGKEFKSWVLLSVFKDSSMLRDVTAFKMFHLMFPGYYASDARLVEVEVNGTYMGVYVLAEQQQANKNRVKISEPEKNSADTQIGYLMEFDNYYYTEKLDERFEINYRGNILDCNNKALQNLTKGYTIKSDVYNSAQKEFIMKYMNDLWKICYEAVYSKKYYKFNYEYRLVEYTPEGDTDDEKCMNCINRIIDTTSLANTYIFNEIVCDPDLYWSSFYMDIDFAEGADKKLRFEAPWDFDSTMGNKKFCVAGNDSFNNQHLDSVFAGKGQPDVNGNGNTYGNPWMMIFINQTWFKNLVKEQWAGINTTALKAELSSFIDETTTNYVTVFNLTRQIWGNSGDNGSTSGELCSASKTAAKQSQADSAEYFKGWLTARIDEVNKIINKL